MNITHILKTVRYIRTDEVNNRNTPYLIFELFVLPLKQLRKLRQSNSFIEKRAELSGCYAFILLIGLHHIIL